MGTSNHVHLLVKDTGSNVIAESMQLIAGCTAQEYSQRKASRARSGKIAITRRRSRPTNHLHTHNPVRQPAAISRGAATLGLIKGC
jgi:hypothetical protein